ncbi:Folylpolyglutamate synthase [Rickettsiales endosymbiont of Paramecium tredecaurelia]|nr:Folylpolyglutamate synthase [Candidatus Sarmatiella mevalonica]
MSNLFDHISWVHHPHQLIKKYDLQKMRAILALLGNPHMHLPPTIHIAGTNGKGSTLATMRSILRCAGYKVHAYTSPHLLKINERIVISDEMISDEYFVQLAGEVEDANKKLQEIEQEDSISFFEGITAVAMLAFARQKADVLLLETGMGGRLDATNVAHPIASVITAIDFDHTQYLGDTLEKIATEKAGIFKRDSLAIVAHQHDCVKERLKQLAHKAGVGRLLLYGKDYWISSDKDSNAYFYYHQSFNSAMDGRCELPGPNLAGEHQKLNTSTAITTLLALEHYFPSINMECIEHGLHAIEWPGRLQLLNPSSYSHLCSENTRIYLDGAHNEAGAAALGCWLRDYNKEWGTEDEHRVNKHKIYIMYGSIHGKCSKSFFQKIFDALDGDVGNNCELIIYSVPILCEDRARPADDIYSELLEFAGCRARCEVGGSIADILQRIDAESECGTCALLVVTGSLFLVADFLALM